MRTKDDIQSKKPWSLKKRNFRRKFIEHGLMYVHAAIRVYTITGELTLV